ncbi:MAG: hypothetical protein ACOCRX_00055 [Candidatus Woesearchaeota archaeon]
MAKHFYDHFKLFHENFNIIIFTLFFLLVSFNLLDLHSTHLVISSEKGIELNPLYPEVNQGIYDRAIKDKIKDITIILLSLFMFLVSIEGILHINNTHNHFLDHAVHHFTWFLKYFVIGVFSIVNVSYLLIVLNNYLIYLI